MNKQSHWVVFTGKTDIGWLKILKPGFRHCYVLIHDGYKWLSIDPLASYTDVEIYHQISPDYDLPSWLEYQGHKIIHVPHIFTKNKSAPIAFFSCVEVVKRLIGLHHPFIITPWQLYQFLISNKEKQYG